MSWRHGRSNLGSLASSKNTRGIQKACGKSTHWVLQMGTLGGGNHFIEICLDEDERVWVMLHSGSRGIGNAIGTYFIDLTRRDMERWFIR